MNKNTIIILAFLALSIYPCYSGVSVQSEDAVREINESIRTGNARETARHFGSTVDLKLPGNEGTYSRNQAELILRNFFSRNAVASFSVHHQRPSKDGSVYVIGTYEAKNGQSYRTYFLVKKISDNMVLHLLQMEEQ
ncbi:MAG: DUF4783 domain-containing protein [bacterium]